MYSNKQEPWYAPAGGKKKSSGWSQFSEKNIKRALQTKAERPTWAWGVIFPIVGTVLCATISGSFVVHALSPTESSAIWWVLAVISFVFGGVLALLGVAQLAHFVLPKPQQRENPFEMAFSLMKGEIRAQEPRKGIPAPELALHQFVSQVRAYATEKSFQKMKTSDGGGSGTGSSHTMESADLLKRRWNEVQDSLNEFEVYLANDPKGMIEKLITKQPLQLIDVSQVFREVAENFDTAWRKKGINIEAAIVTPLRATTHEALLRRLLVGPWRYCAYFARRGNSVLFSAKSEEGKVVARWECEGLSIPPEYLEYVQDDTIAVNERIEKGLNILTQDPIQTPNVLHALVSFVIWVDLANLAQISYEFKNNNNGFVVEVKLH